MPKRIVLATFGSLGDLHPSMAIALGLTARGHEAVIAASGVYRQKVEEAGIGFAAVRPDLPSAKDAADVIRAVMDERDGPRYLFQKILMPALQNGYDDLFAATDGADLLVSHVATYAAPVVAEKRRLRWVSTLLQPALLLSAYDPPVFNAPLISPLCKLGPGIARRLLRIPATVARIWTRPVRDLRRSVGLPPGQAPGFDGQRSPFADLALFSRVLASPQPDWPRQTRQTGFCFYDRLGAGQGLSRRLDEFLGCGDPPIVFTLGSAAVMAAGDFYRESIEAARRLGRRAVLLTGPDPASVPEGPPPGGIIAESYAPYSEILPRAAAVVHQGGAGTTGQALRAGVPMLVMPYSHDQPDNAARVARLGIARTIRRRRYTAERAEIALRALLEAPSYAERAAKIGQIVRSEDGVAAACDAIGEQFAKLG